MAPLGLAAEPGVGGAEAAELLGAPVPLKGPPTITVPHGHWRATSRCTVSIQVGEFNLLKEREQKQSGERCVPASQERNCV